jgi:hypothetical protein
MVHAHYYDVKDFPRVRKVGFSLGRLIIPPVHITPRPHRFTPPPTSPKDDTRDDCLEPCAGPGHSSSEGETPPAVLARVTVTLSHYPGGDLIETPEFVQSITPMSVLDLTEFLQTWGGPHLYCHDRWNNIDIVSPCLCYTSLQAVVHPNGETHVLPLFCE